MRRSRACNASARRLYTSPGRTIDINRTFCKLICPRFYLTCLFAQVLTVMDHPLLASDTSHEAERRFSNSDTDKPFSEDGQTLNESTCSQSGGEDCRAHKRHMVMCILLHTGLVVAHLVLVGVYTGHYENRANGPISTFSTTWLPLILTTGLQTIGTVSTHP